MAIVKQQYVAASQALRQPLEYDTRIGADRVEASPGPACEPQSEVRQYRLQKGAAQTGRRAKESWPLSRDRLDRGLSSLDFRCKTRRTEHGEPMEMMLTVVLNRMTTADDFPRQFRVLLDTLADAEKSSFGAMLIQQIEHARRNCRIRPIVNRNRYRSGRRRCSRQMGPVGSQQFASWPQARSCQ